MLLLMPAEVQKSLSMKMLDMTAGNNAFAEKDFLKWIHSKSKKQNNEIQQNIINIIFIFNRYE